MNGLIGRLKGIDPEFTVLSLTSECETPEEVDRLLEALEQKKQSPYAIQSVVFRESFFPLRRLREHLPRADFWRMIEGVSKHAQDSMRMPSHVMMGMVRGSLAALTIVGPHLQAYHANETITFGSHHDVEVFAQAIQENCQDHLRVLQLGDCFVLRRKPPALDPIVNVVSLSTNLTHLELSVHHETTTRIKSAPALLTAEALRNLLTQAASLELLNLSRMGMADDEFQEFASFFQTAASTRKSLKQLCLDGNRPTDEGLQVLMESLRDGNTCLESLSLQSIKATHLIPWNNIFPSNVYLCELEMDCRRASGGNNGESSGFGEGSLGNVRLPRRVEAELDFWLDLNRRNRKYWMPRKHVYGSIDDIISESNSGTGSDHEATGTTPDGIPVALWPIVLESLSRIPSAIWYLLETQLVPIANSS